jgi:DNA polymerase-3 subunit gamma/tau
MSYQVLARKWRPRRFEELVGQQHVIQALINGLDQDRVHHAFLFSGTRGVGKTTLARILAKCLNCEGGVSSKPCGECASCIDIDEGRFVDMLEIDAASRTKVEDTRELLESVQYTPNRGRYKIYIIDEVHMLSNNSFNALLKTLEEPPPHVKFVLATTDPERIPVTILSRCLQFNLRRLLPPQIQEQLHRIVAAEGIEAEPDALARLARSADGSMRDGLSLLDQAIAFGAGKVSAANVDQMLGLVDHGHIVSLLTALAAGQAAGLLEIVAELVGQSRDLDAVLVNLAETLHRVCLAQSVPEYQDDERSDWVSIRKLAEQISAEDAQLYYQIAIKGREELGLAPDPRTGLEMTLLRMLAFRPAASGEPQAGVGQRDANLPGAEDGRRMEAARSVGAGDPARGRHSPRPARPVARHSDSVRASPAPDRVTEADRSEATATEPEPPRDDADWIALSRRLRLSGQARELARNLHLQSRQDDRWEFVIAHSLRHLGSAPCVDRLSRAISDQMGHPVRIRLIDSADLELKTVANLEEQRLRTKMTDAELAIERDPTIRSLKDEMGASIITDSIQPLQ